MFVRRWLSVDSKANLVICHGIGEHCGRYDRFASFMTRNGFNVFSTDLPGHGMHSGQRGYIGSFKEFLDAVVTLEEAVKSEMPDMPVFLFGHSMGGLISSRVVEEYPEAFKALVMSSPHLFSAKESVKGLLPIINFVKRVAPKVTFSSSSRFTPADLSNNKRAVQRYIEDPYVHDRVSPNLFLGMEENIDLAMEKIDNVKIPVMVVIGSEDRVVDPAGARSFYERLKTNKELLEIPGGKHEMFADEDRYETLFNGVLGFFSKFI